MDPYNHVDICCYKDAYTDINQRGSICRCIAFERLCCCNDRRIGEIAAASFYSSPEIDERIDKVTE